MDEGDFIIKLGFVYSAAAEFACILFVISSDWAVSPRSNLSNYYILNYNFLILPFLSITFCYNY